MKSRPRKLEYMREYYLSGRNAVLRSARRAQTRRVVDGLKKAPCLDCGKTFPSCAMDFDHVRGPKAHGGLAHMMDANIDTILAEITKCDLVCANCHRIRTHILRKSRECVYSRK